MAIVEGYFVRSAWRSSENRSLVHTADRTSHATLKTTEVSTNYSRQNYNVLTIQNDCR